MICDLREGSDRVNEDGRHLSCVLRLVMRFISGMQLSRYPRSHVLAQSSLYVAHDVCCVTLFPETTYLKRKTLKKMPTVAGHSAVGFLQLMWKNSRGR